MTQVVPGLLWEVVAGVGTMTLDRPRRGNALTFDVVDAASLVIRDAEIDPHVRVIVVTGSGQRAFCTGVDLKEIADPVSALSRKSQLHDHIQPFIYALATVRKPTIAGMNGDATGAGLDLALACDMRVLARTATLSETYVDLGLISGAGGAHFLPRLVGRAKAMELLLTADRIDAREAQRIGLVNCLADAETTLEQTHSIARKIAAKAPLSVSMMKRAVHECSSTELRTSLELLSSQYAVLATSHDAAEALSAMIERRQPVFTGL